MAEAWTRQRCCCAAAAPLPPPSLASVSRRAGLPLLAAAPAAARRRPGRRRAVDVCARKRLLAWVLSTPRRVELYFEAYPLRKAVWCAISTGLGFYAGNVATLSFGALAINDILAAVLTLAFYEAATYAFYTADKPGLRLWFLNCFKIGMTAALLADALKLGA